MESSFRKDDVTLLLKDLTGRLTPLPTEVRERRIKTGTHYSEMLPLEYRPSEKYIRTYEAALDVFGQSTADAAAAVSEKIYRKKGIAHFIFILYSPTFLTKIIYIHDIILL